MYYPDNTSERYYYDANGNMNRVTFNGQDVWKLTSYNGTARKTQLRDSLSREEYHTADGYLNHTRIRYKSSGINTLIYTFDKKKGLLLSRSGMLANGTNENFTYDSHDRLTETYTANNDLYHSVDYATNGNIVNKTGIGAYSYESDRPHAVTSVDNIEGAVSEIPQYVTYTPFNKVATVTQGEYSLAITYGPDRQRNKTALSRNDTLLYTRYYADNYEEVHAGDTIYRYYYVYTPDGLSMIAERIGNTMNLKLYSVETDYLGSIVSLYNYKGQTEFRAEYDAWGGQNVVTDNLAHFQRGYCGHEHWHEFDLIDMNGRMYDPVISRFLSPDPFVQAPEDLQNYNRYSYCLNNPLKYTDPSGEIFWEAVAIGAVIGGIVNVTAAYSKSVVNNRQTIAYFVAGALVGGVSALCGGVGVAGIVPGSFAGAALGGISGAASTATLTVANNLISGNEWNTGVKGALLNGFVGGAIWGAISGGVSGFNNAKVADKNLWWGNDIKFGREQNSFWNVEKPYDVVEWGKIENIEVPYDGMCYPESMTEANHYFGGKKTLDDYSKKVCYSIKDKGTHVKYEVYNEFIDNEFISMYKNGASKYILGDPQKMCSIQEQGWLVNTYSPNHIDNIRQIEYYSNKTIIRFRNSHVQLHKWSGWIYILQGNKL